ncbi:MAG: hypothetical protein ABEI97_00685 [Candidatus Nanohaloarchaea archaeon]
MRRYALLLVVAVLLAGCTGLPSQSSQEETPDVIQVEGPDCRVGGSPCSSGAVTRYSGSIDISLTVHNNGDLPVTVQVAQPRQSDQNGRAVMISKCNDELVGIDSFGGTVTGPSRYTELTDVSSYTDDAKGWVTVGGNQRLDLTWTLSVPSDADISELGNSCLMAFELAFNQSLRTRTQVQIKRSTSVADVASLGEETTSKRPVRLRIDAPSRFVAEDGKKLVARAFLENRGTGTITNVTAINASESSGIFADIASKQAAGATGYGAKCSPRNVALRMFGEGPREGQSYRKTCTISYSPSSASEVTWLPFEAEYSYRMDLGSRAVTLEPVEGG